MINVKELMIGNYVEVSPTNNYGEPYAEVVEIFDYGQVSTKGFFAMQSDLHMRHHQLDPILLNDEWFKKLGFNTSKCRITNTTTTSKNTDNGYISYIDNYQGVITIGKTPYSVKYVHQLQNLVKITTGENLKLIRSPYDEKF